MAVGPQPLTDKIDTHKWLFGSATPQEWILVHLNKVTQEIG